MIALLAPFYPYNYGTVLQAYALHRVISKLGYESEYISYSVMPQSTIDKIRILISYPKNVGAIAISQWISNHIKNKKEHFDYTGSKNRNVKNQLFISSNIPHSTFVYNWFNINDIVDRYELIITGSDQTWSPLNPYYIISPYFQRFHSNSVKKRSYACSLGGATLPLNEFITSSLKDFNNVCVRETYSQQRLEPELDKHVKVVLDPTLLINADEWTQLEHRVEVNSKYVLCYILGSKKIIIDYAEKIAKFLGGGCQLVVIQSNNIVKDHRALTDIGVSEFLWLIHHAEYVVTDSFHGTLFSLNYSKQFTSFNKRSGDSMDNGRIGDILSRVGLADHILKDSGIVDLEYIDYSKVQECISNLRRDSISYLEDVVLNA